MRDIMRISYYCRTIEKDCTLNEYTLQPDDINAAVSTTPYSKTNMNIVEVSYVANCTNYILFLLYY